MKILIWISLATIVGNILAILYLRFYGELKEVSWFSSLLGWVFTLIFCILYSVQRGYI